MTRRHDHPTTTDTTTEDTMTSTTSKYPRLAVYGTLREGHALSGWLDDLDLIVEGTVPGGIFYVHDESGFPVYRYDVPGRVAVEVYQASNPVALRALARVLDMEAGAGYTIGNAEVTVAGTGDIVTALICVWDHAHGARVPGDDWNEARPALDGWIR